MSKRKNIRAAVLICARVEWEIVLSALSPTTRQTSPLGEWCIVDMNLAQGGEPVLFFHIGWGKISAAASTQYVIDRWAPVLLVNLGTCGGFEGEVNRGSVLLVKKTIVYDLVSQIGDHRAAIMHYTTDIDLSWLKPSRPQDVLCTLMVSGDRDLIVEDIPRLKADYGAVAGDWESGAIAYVAAHNAVRCLILRGVTDLVGTHGGEAYEGRMPFFVQNATAVLQNLVASLPAWLAASL